MLQICDYTCTFPAYLLILLSRRKTELNDKTTPTGAIVVTFQTKIFTVTVALQTAMFTIGVL